MSVCQGTFLVCMLNGLIFFWFERGAQKRHEKLRRKHASHAELLPQLTLAHDDRQRVTCKLYPFFFFFVPFASVFFFYPSFLLSFPSIFSSPRSSHRVSLFSVALIFGVPLVCDQELNDIRLDEGRKQATFQELKQDVDIYIRHEDKTSRF